RAPLPVHHHSQGGPPGMPAPLPQTTLTLTVPRSVSCRRPSRSSRRPSSTYTDPMPPKPLSAEYFDGWYADQAAMPTVAEIMNRHMGFPRGRRAGVVPAEAVPELAEELRLKSGGTLLDIACGRGAYGLLVAKQAG